MHGGKPYRLAPRRGAGAGLGRRAALQAEGIWQSAVDRQLESQLTHRSGRGTVRCRSGRRSQVASLVRRRTCRRLRRQPHACAHTSMDNTQTQTHHVAGEQPAQPLGARAAQYIGCAAKSCQASDARRPRDSHVALPPRCLAATLRRRHAAMPPRRLAAMPLRRLAPSLPRCLVVTSPCRPVTTPPRRFAATSPHCHTATLSRCHVVTLPHRRAASSPHCHATTLPRLYAATLPRR